jgi:8-oxo-dGTP pyrophosphatase MutT (NUDIX family)
MTQSGESDNLRRALRQVVEIMDTTEDEAAIRKVIEEAGITPGVHVGDPPETFDGDPVKTAEYLLGQWADGIDSKSPFLNSFRNITHAWIEQGKVVL